MTNAQRDRELLTAAIIAALQDADLEDLKFILCYIIME